MRRKVIQLAGKTLVVSLPSKWAKKSLIRKGDELEVVESEHSLTINPVEKKICAKTVIDVSGLNSSLVWHYLTAAYIKGVEEIDVRFSDAEILNPRTKKMVKTVEFIGSVVSSLIGMELVRYGETFCVVTEVSEVKRDEFDIVLKRLFFTLCTFAADVVKALGEKNSVALKNCAHLEKTVNRLCLFCWRALSKGVFSTPVEIAAYYNIVSVLEEIADVYARVCELSEKSVKNAELKRSLVGTAQVVKGLYDIFYDFNKKKCAEFYDDCQMLKGNPVFECLIIVNKCLSVLSARIMLVIDIHSGE